MNRDILEGKWKQLRGEVKRQWGELTDDDLDVVNGNLDVLIGMLQQRYGYSREQAESEVDRFVRESESYSNRL